MIPRNNPTSNRALFTDNLTKTNAVKPKYSNMKELEILCMSNICTTFDKNGKLDRRIKFRHDTRNERYVCDVCGDVVSEKELNYVVKAELPEYKIYDEESPKNIKEIDEERERDEKYMIKPINMESPFEKSKKRVAKVIK